MQTATRRTTQQMCQAADQGIQTWKDAFIAALATTDSDFPLQLWDRLTKQVQDTLNLMRASRIDPTKSVYEILNGPYDWNRYPLAHWDERRLYMKTVTQKDHGHREVLMDGT